MQARSNIIFGKRAYDRATVYCRSQERIVLVFWTWNFSTWLGL